MSYLVSNLVKSCEYKLSFFHKILSRCGLKNHFELTKDELLKLYACVKVNNHKSFTLRIVLEELLKDDLHSSGGVK